MKRLGILFMVLVIALAGIGAAFAAWTDVITIQGTVTTGNVDITVERYSGTEAWKVEPHGIEVIHGWMPLPTPSGTPVGTEPVGKAIARAGTTGEADVVFEFVNLFPCVEFCADILVHYDGSIPAMVDFKMLSADQWIIDAIANGNVTVNTYLSNAAGDKGQQVAYPIQMHKCNYLLIEICTKVPQVKEAQGLSGKFEAYIGVIQWNKYGEWGQYFPPR